METEERIRQFLSGYGFGYGYGYGYGFGAGFGDGDGDGDGAGYGDKLEFLADSTYEIDGIFCRFERIHKEWAKVTVISKADFSESLAFIAKYENCFAHGNTIREAMQDAMEKYFSKFDFEQAKESLIAKFKEKKRLTVAELYNWHGALTGSCRFGRSQFQREHGLKDEDTLSLEEFVELCGNAYGGEKIKKLLAD